jgi:transforming growth factor-beta-induced protein
VACEGDEGRPEYPNFDQDLDELLQAEPDASTFYDLIKATTFLPALKGGATFTVLAPSNSAFTGVNIDMLKEDPDALSDLVRFHILSGTVDAALLDLGGEFRTITSTIVRVVSNGEVTFHDSHGNMATLTKPDVGFAKNGVLHVISGLLRPPDPPVMGPGDLEEELMGFGSLLSALMRAMIDIGAAMGPITVFAPNDAAFTALGDISGVNNDVLVNVLMHHVVDGSHPFSELQENPTLTTWAKLPLVVAGNGMMAGNAAVGTMRDIMASNGIAHELTGVIYPATILEYVAMANTMLGNTNEAITRSAADLGMALSPNVLMGAMPITFFAPVGMSWTMAGIDTRNADTSTLAAILRRHTVTGQILVSELTQDQILTTLNGTVAVDLAGGAALVDGEGNRFVIDADASDIRTLTGAVHRGDGVLTNR